MIAEEFVKNPVVDLTPNFQNYSKLYAEVIEIQPNGNVWLRVVREVLKPGHKPSEKIETSKRHPKKVFPLKINYIRRAKIVNDYNN